MNSTALRSNRRSALAVLAGLCVGQSGLSCQTYADELLRPGPPTTGGAGSAAATAAGGGGAPLAGGGQSVSGTGGSSMVSAGDAAVMAAGGAAMAEASGAGGQGSEPQLELIDDGEDADAFVLPAHGRNGEWSVSNDASPGGIQAPKVGSTFMMTALEPFPRPGSAYAAHTSGDGFKVWGAILSVGWRFLPDYNAIPTYDASAYSGLSFVARSSESATTHVSVRWLSADTDPRGGVCQASGTPQTACFNHFAVDLPVTAEWTRFTLPFANFHQVTSGMRFDAINLKRAYGIEFFFPPGDKFDLWVDDLSFTLD